MAKRRSKSKRRSYTVEKWAFGLLAGVTILVTFLEWIANNQSAAIIMAMIGGAAIAVIWIIRKQLRDRNRRSSAERARHLGQLLMVSGEEFEVIVRDLFLSLGYRNLERIGGSGDLGVDLVGRDSTGLKVIVQCKRYGAGQKIGSPAIQALMGAVVHHGADRGIFVTTSTFTAPAVQHAKGSRVLVDLVDGESLTQMATGLSRLQ